MSFLTVVVDDTAQNPEILAAEHGLSFWLRHQDKNILFDTGAGEALMPNLKALDLDPVKLDAVVISHGHFDHIGGLAQLLMARSAEGRSTPVFISNQAFITHLATRPSGMDDVGAPLEADAYQNMGAKFHFVDGQARLWPGVVALCPIERVTDFEGPDPTLYSKRGGKFVSDEMPDDLALVFKGSSGICVLSGCAHSGLFNILEAAKKLTRREPAYFAGGTHLDGVSEEQRIASLAELTRWSNLKLASGHCTGFDISVQLADIMQDRFTPLTAGERIQV